MIYHVTCSTDDNYLQHCMAMLCSLFENNKNHKFHVHLLVHSLSQNGRNLISNLGERYQNKTIIYDIDNASVENLKMNTLARFNGKQMYSVATYYRIFLPSLLPSNIDRILYLDCDVIVLSDVAELYELNLNNYAVAAVKDSTPVNSYHRFKMGLDLQHNAFCAGVMMINLDFWRETNAQDALIEYSSRNWKHVYMQDQDALNYVFRDHWFMLPYKWGKTLMAVAPVDTCQRWFDIREYVFRPCIIHYSSHEKPWLDIWLPDRKYYWDYLHLSNYPNPVVTPLYKKLKIKIYIKIGRYFIARYIRPIVPDFIELLLRDILNTIKFIINLFRPTQMKEYLLKRWCQKYRM